MHALCTLVENRKIKELFERSRTQYVEKDLKDNKMNTMKLQFTSEDNLSPNCMPSDRAHLNAQAPKQLLDVLTYSWDGNDPSQADCNSSTETQLEKKEGEMSDSH